MNKTIKISGMACMHCVNSVKEALTSAEGVTDVTVDLQNGVATVTTDKDDSFLSDIISSLGFEVEYIK